MRVVVSSPDIKHICPEFLLTSNSWLQRNTGTQVKPICRLTVYIYIYIYIGMCVYHLTYMSPQMLDKPIVNL